MRLAFASVLAAALLWPASAQAQSGSTPIPVGTGGVVGMGPNGATMRCKDGFFPVPGADDAACQARGGVAVRWPLKRTPSRAADANAAALREAGTRPRVQTALQQPDTTRPPGFEPFAQRRARADSTNRAVGTMPAGATLLCNDGTWVVRDTSSARCAAHRGVRLSFPERPR